MKILFIGVRNGNAYKRYKAIKKLYKTTEPCFTDHFYNNKLFYKIFYHLLPNIMNFHINFFFKKKVTKFYDLIFINNEAFLTKKDSTDLYIPASVVSTFHTNLIRAW